MKLTPSLLSQWFPGALSDMRALDIKDKEISHIEDISMCTQLARIDLAKNALRHADSLSGLRYCQDIKWRWFFIFRVFTHLYLKLKPR